MPISAISSRIGKRPTETLTTFTLNPTAQSGYIESQSVSSYSAAQNGSSLAQHNASILVGQGYQFSGTDLWTCYEGFLDFNLSTVVGTVVSATLSLGLHSNNSSVSYTLEARQHDYGSTLTTADWRTPANFGSDTLLATVASSTLTAGFAYYVLTESGTALRTAVTGVRPGVLRMVLGSNRFRLGNTPAENETATFKEYNHATLKPKLVIVTS